MAVELKSGIDNLPDVFADAVGVAANPFAVSLTFLLTDPVEPAGSLSARAVTRVRLSPELARALGDALVQAGQPAKLG